MSWLGKVFRSLKQGPEQINNYFRNAVKVYALSGEEASRAAALTAAKVAAHQQRASMVAYLRGMASDSRREGGAGDVADRLEGLAEDITTKDWSVADIREAKLALGKLSPEYLTALNGFDPHVFERRWPSLFGETPSEVIQSLTARLTEAGDLTPDQGGAMTLSITVTSTELDGPRKEAKRLESIIAQEKIEAFVVPGACLPEILQSWGVRQLPVFRINDVTVWEGEKPPADLVRSWLHWPKTLEEAVEQVLASVPDIPEGPLAHHGLGTTIRSSFGLWGANKDLLRSCGSETMHADDAFDVILNAARQVLRARKQGDRSR